MNTKKTIAVGLAALMFSLIAACAVPMVGADVSGDTTPDYIATVTSTTFDITVEVKDTDFGELARGTAGDIDKSLKIKNKGSVGFTMSAAFTTQRGGTYGMNSTNDVIPGTNFGMKEHSSSSYTVLTATTTATTICSSTAKDTYIDVKLDVPSGVHAEDYSGTIELTFS